MVLRVGLVAGEASGDVLGAGLVSAIRRRRPDAVFEGIAGPAMAEAGCEVWEEADTLAVMGLVEPLKVLPKLLRIRRGLVRRWRESPPDVFVGIDAPDFNLGLETALRREGILTVHYVSPTLWAWRPGRLETVRRAADLVLCLLPFEKTLYDDNGIRAEFVGHPKADSLDGTKGSEEARRALGLPVEGQVVAILPGSRASEIARLGSVFAAAAARLAQTYPGLRFVLPIATRRLEPAIRGVIEASGIGERVLLVEGRSELAMSAADVVLLASGTAALEAALLARPTVAAYRVAPLTAAIVRGFRLIKLEHFTLPNLLTETPLVPEFIQQDATAEALAEEVGKLLDDPARRAGIRERFARLKAELALNADERAADAVLELLAGSR